MKSCNCNWDIYIALILANIVIFSDAGNIAHHGSSFCFKRIPRKSQHGNCTSDEHCRDIVNVPYDTPVRCGIYGECVIGTNPTNEFCKDACASSPCVRLCLGIYRTKTAKYCIRTSDHPNSISQGPREPNKFQCTCIR